MSAIDAALRLLSDETARLTARLGRRVEVSTLGVIDRTGVLPLAEPGLTSPNGACRLFPTADGWMALNLAREEDSELVPAWLGGDFGRDPWAQIADLAPQRSTLTLIEAAELLGLPAAGVGEVACETPEARRVRIGAGVERRGRLKAVDLSALWAGPMCGAILAAAGVAVTRIESLRRPDPTRASTPEFFHRLNGQKAELALDLANRDDQRRLADLVAGGDVLITGARPRALGSLGLSLEAVMAANPGLVWVAISGYGWTGPAPNRVAFGDDAAAAGGLVRWTPEGPHFLGDALADPVTGLAAAVGALQALEAGGGLLVDASLARSAAGAAAVCGWRTAA